MAGAHNFHVVARPQVLRFSGSGASVARVLANGIRLDWILEFCVVALQAAFGGDSSLQWSMGFAGRA